MPYAAVPDISMPATCQPSPGTVLLILIRQHPLENTPHRRSSRSNFTYRRSSSTHSFNNTPGSTNSPGVFPRNRSNPSLRSRIFQGGSSSSINGRLSDRWSRQSVDSINEVCLQRNYMSIQLSLPPSLACNMPYVFSRVSRTNTINE